MKIERFEIPGLAQYSYIVSSQGKAAVIDPIRDVERYLTYAEEQGLTIVAVTETHIHADFASGAAVLAETTGAELALSAHDEGQQYHYMMPHRALKNGDVLELGVLQLVALHTPGHTPEHLSFVLFDKERSETDPVALFSGDFLFVGSLGRPDLLGEAAKQHLARELYCSLHERIASLPDGVQIYPGHGAGSLCGAGMSERAESTLGYERATQPLFKLDEQSFVREVMASVPPMPSYYPRMKKLNADGASSLHYIPAAKSLSPGELGGLLADENVSLLDLRRPEAFGGAHIEGAINIGAGQNLSLWAGWMLEPGKPIVLVGDGGEDEASRLALLRVGLDQIRGRLAKGMAAWIDEGREFTRTAQLSVREVVDRDMNTLVLDVRTEKEWRDGHISGARHMMLGDLPKHMQELPRDTPLVTVCGSGYRSSIAASLLQAAGFSNVSSMDGGMSAWNAQHGHLTGKQHEDR